MADEKYFNFPIQLLKGFLVDSGKVLSDIANYAVYAHSTSLEYNEELSAFRSAASFYNIKFGKPVHAFDNGKELYEEYSEDSPMVGITLSMYWDFNKDNKSEVQKLHLLGFLALKSILGNKTFCKTDNRMLFSRMDGQVKKLEFWQLSEEMYKYCSTKHKANYWAPKIRAEVYRWEMKSYSVRTHGFYISLKLSIDDLVFEAEKRKLKYKELEQKNEIQNARAKALERLNAKPP